MIDFTLKSYAEYVNTIKDRFESILKFEEYFSHNNVQDRFCIIRHDVDRKPENALKMAELEHDMGIYSTYFFRTKKHVFDKKIIRKIARMGHEIGYHYESLSDQNGNFNAALADFKHNLFRMRQIVKVTTICMHGRPFSNYDNKKLLKSEENRKLLFEDLSIKGEVYIDIDYSDIAYLSDTGRNWSKDISNIRDKIDSGIQTDLNKREDLVGYLKNSHGKLILLIHPERWSDDFWSYSNYLFIDIAVNFIKKFYK